jgi:hypothetical protein
MAWRLHLRPLGWWPTARVSFHRVSPGGRAVAPSLDGPDALAKLVGVHGLTWDAALAGCSPGQLGAFELTQRRARLLISLLVAVGSLRAPAADFLGDDGASTFTAPQ